MKGHLFEKKERFSIRKFSVEFCSHIDQVSIFRNRRISADETVSGRQPLEASSARTEDVNHLVREASVYARCDATTADPAKSATERSLQRLVLQSTEASSTTTDTPAVSETENQKATAEKSGQFTNQ